MILCYPPLEEVEIQCLIDYKLNNRLFAKDTGGMTFLVFFSLFRMSVIDYRLYLYQYLYDVYNVSKKLCHGQSQARHPCLLGKRRISFRLVTANHKNHYTFRIMDFGTQSLT